MVAGSESFLSRKEGVTQGDPLSMFLYAASTLPLISALKGGGVTQVWYADDASVCGKLVKIQDWFNRLMQLGPKYGYHPEPRKTVLVVDDAFVDKAESIFCSSGVKVVQSCWYLGGVIGNEGGRIQYVREVVNQWLLKLKKLTTIAEQQPQAAYSALVKSLQGQWKFVQRVVSGCGSLFSRIESALATELLPVIMGCEVSDDERALFALPPRVGGLGIFNPVKRCDLSYTSSRK